MIRHLYQVGAGGAEYFVVAPTSEEALQLIADAESWHEDDTEFQELEVVGHNEGNDPDFVCRARGREFFIDGVEGETCSVWLAYQIVRTVASMVLCCSEWP